MDTKELKKKKETLKRILIKEQNEHCALMYFLICNGKLDEIISKMDDTNIIPNTTCLIKKGYLSSEEHFLEVLYHVINTINTDFWIITKKNSIIELILKHPKSSKLLLTKKYIGNNDFIPYYQFNIKKMCIYSFFDTLKFVYKTTIIANFLEANKINLDNINLNRKKDVDTLYKTLILICLCNYSSFGLYYIFDYQLDLKLKDMCTIQLEMLIENTNKIKDSASAFLESLH